MASQGTPQGTLPYNYDPFANDPFYVKVNSDLVGLVNALVPGGLSDKSIADIASGTGLIPDLCCKVSRPKLISCSDINPSAAPVAEKNLRPYSGATDFKFYTADAISVPLQSSSADVVFGTNFIHLVKEKAAVVCEAARLLVPGGYLAINTAFHTECYVPGTESNWRRWVAEAWRYAREKRLVLERDHVEVTAREWLTPEEYCGILKDNGFRVIHALQVPVRLGTSALEAIAQYAEFAAGAFHINPSHTRASEYIRNASQALVAVVSRAFPSDGVERNWLQLVAQKA